MATNRKPDKQICEYCRKTIGEPGKVYMAGSICQGHDEKWAEVYLKPAPTKPDTTLRSEIEQLLWKVYDPRISPNMEVATQSILDLLAKRFDTGRLCEDDCGLTMWSCNELQSLVYTDETLDRRNKAVEIRKDMRDFYAGVRAIIEEER